jgi:putative SOS response-associated peptidase YedK
VIITTNRHRPRRRRPRPNPLILPRDRVDAWFDPARTKPEQIYQILDGIVLNPSRSAQVSSRVNRVDTDGPAS